MVISTPGTFANPFTPVPQVGTPFIEFGRQPSAPQVAPQLSQQQLEDEYRNLYSAEAQRLNTAQQAKFAGVTPDQYAAIINDPKYADLYKYATPYETFGAPKADKYTQDLLNQWANTYSKVQDPTIPKNLTSEGLNFYKEHPEYLGVGQRGPLGSILNMNPYFAGALGPQAESPEELRKRLDAQLKDPMISTELAYDKLFSNPYGSYKKNEPVSKYGGAFFNAPGVSPSAVQKPAGGWVNYQKSVRDTPGAGLITIGIDPEAPDVEARAKAWVDYHKARGTGFWQEGAWGKEYGREDARMPGWATLRKQYPKASTYQLLDAMMRGQVGQSALKPRSFDFMQIIDPIIEAGLTIASGGNPTLAVLYGAGRGGSENGWLGAFTGGLQGYGVGNLTGGVQAAGGIGNYASNAISNFGKGLGSFLEHPIDFTTGLVKDTASNIGNAVMNPFGEGELSNINNLFTGEVGRDIAARAATPASALATAGRFSGPTERALGSLNRLGNFVPQQQQVGPTQPPMQALPPPASTSSLITSGYVVPNLLGTEDVLTYGGPYSQNYATYSNSSPYYGVKEGGMISSHRYADGGSVMIDPMNPMSLTQHGNPTDPRDMMGNLDGKSHMRTTSQGIASLGRHGDSMLVHMSPEEIRGLQQLGIASGRPMTVNPVTGLPEAFKLKDLLPSLGGAALSLVFPEMSPLSAGLLTGAATGLLTGDWEKGLMGGIGGFGGASLTQGLMGAGGAGRSARMREPSYDEIARDTGDIAAAPRTAGERGLRIMGADTGGIGGRLAATGKGVSNIFSEGLKAFPQVEGAGILGSGGRGLALSSLAAAAPAMAASARRSDKGARPIEKNPYAPYGQQFKPISQGLHYGYDEAGNRKYILDKDGNVVQQLFVSGGIADLAHGGTAPKRGGYLDGPGDGMSDSIPATIEGNQPARLADGEFVIPADVVSGLGNGSSKAGAKVLYSMMDRVRHARTGTKKQGKQIKADKYLPA